MTEALFYEKHADGRVKCFLCPHGCTIASGKTGVCGVRENHGGVLYAAAYGEITSLAVDPIEKKPLYHFYPGKKILSVGSYGCNFKCGFCQNHAISMDRPETKYISPDVIAAMAEKRIADGNIGVAYTYNEPFINYEYVYDCAVRVRERGLKNVLVTNGFVSPEPLERILPYIDAMNIDLKSFNGSFYSNVGGRLDTVKQTIERAAKSTHVEVTTLIIPNENDTAGEIDALSGWLASLDPSIPLHLSRFFPRFKMADKHATTREAVTQLRDIALRHLRYVYAGNM